MNADIITTGPQPLSMSSREIADLCEKQHKHVMRDIKVMLDQLGLGEEGYAQNWTNPQNGQAYPEYTLPKDLPLTLVAGCNVVLRKRIIDRWMELQNRAQSFDPSRILESPAAMRGLLLSYSEKVIALEAMAEAGFAPSPSLH